MRKPDDRRDNAERIRRNVEATRENMEAAEEMIARTSDEKTRAALQDKNQRRRRCIPRMEREMRQEAEHQEKK